MVKRLFDLVAASAGLAVCSPVLLLVAALIKREDGGPVLYKSTRVGKDGHPFKMYKFRTMVPNADKIGGPDTPEDDPRITRVGQQLRRYKIDELPQLVNVLLGEMSLVGPRPEVLDRVALYTEEERELLCIRPGITDWASIRFRNEGEILRASADPERTYLEKIRPEKVRLGLEYVRHHTILDDFQILLRTAAAAFETERAGNDKQG